MQKAERFVERLIVLAEQSKMPRLGVPSTLYEPAKQRVRAFIQAGGRGHPGGVPGPTVRYPKFTRWATGQLEAAGLKGELLEVAAEAVQALLVRELAETRKDAATVCQPFERTIPYDTL
jgi:hypothetical protein